eukprot:892832-Prymnesium_polylepis.2
MSRYTKLKPGTETRASVEESRSEKVYVQELSVLAAFPMPMRANEFPPSHDCGPTFAVVQVEVRGTVTWRSKLAPSRRAMPHQRACVPPRRRCLCHRDCVGTLAWTSVGSARRGEVEQHVLNRAVLRSVGTLKKSSSTNAESVMLVYFAKSH